ncbi:CubicO group peptidase, beta-lactamase class C family [Actinopolymorpha cephalotaxi]|uniref:CubicO group peptidase (Beta-lactamase class C family) n=1 Tax=Actinopolymorpha cephalotaxi TaxID=504797 RepID=A0A1I2VJ53_9ACTN|nr:serine hydrolase domain-containing protein [Actinopolymorpha cephalotaxi]NYH84852.1 CubicO group peptidase (beta-lactamase class C family) [Actinopolymorpha cephalotaxi]SFG87506.1 CubicO group peptidase, beta-lactamase class C family [Actinopolymorpha cephalotaxi]
MSTENLSKARLARMHDTMAAHVARGTAPGLVTLVSRRGETHVDTIGLTEVDGRSPMARDTIFRISSMTKPVTAVAAMILVEECQLRLDDPVDTLLPELADRQVLRRLDGSVTDTVPATRPISVRDLLTFQLGFGVLFAPPGTYPIQDAIAEAGIGDGPPQPATLPGPNEWLRRFSTLPLMHQPGERWMYNTGADLLGVLIERASGQSLETFCRRRIFEPLGMKDTAFSVPANKLNRFATSYEPDPETGALRVYDPAAGGQWASPPAFQAGGSGLVSTVDDYAAFGQMMLAGGRSGNERIVSRTTVQAMVTDHLTPRVKEESGFFPGYFDSRSWGFGLAVVTRRDSPSAVPGQFGWDGGLGTSWYSDPREGLTAILMTQRSGFPQLSEVYLDFWTSVYQTLDD